MAPVAIAADIEAAPVYQLDPLTDPRWAALVDRHPQASIFHTVSWLRALQQTYGYEPVAVTTAPPGAPLTDGAVFCRIRSWLTGRRVVSLPFSDHCQPLVQTERELHTLISGLVDAKFKSAQPVEIRTHALLAGSSRDEEATFCFHRIDLRPTPDQLFARFHKDCVQRKIRRAQREGVTIESGRSADLLERFYVLLEQSRQHQKVPAQPRAWFDNLIALLGDALMINVASKDGRTIAAILTLRHGRTMVYKYGCSDRQCNNLGGMPALLWNSMLQARCAGLTEFDLGRSDWDNPGLIQFKDRWGTMRSNLYYLRISTPENASTHGSRTIPALRYLASFAPERLVAAMGRRMYHHFGCL